MADAILQTKLPAIDLRGALVGLGIPFIGVDNRPVASMGFEHLKNCGLRNFAFCGTPRGENPNQDLRCDYFVACVEEAGFKCNVHCGASGAKRKLTWERQQQEIVAWL
jgi:DNA-binding LacI/PurR family transcriptional regulator